MLCGSQRPMTHQSVQSSLNCTTESPAVQTLKQYTMCKIHRVQSTQTIWFSTVQTLKYIQFTVYNLPRSTGFQPCNLQNSQSTQMCKLNVYNRANSQSVIFAPNHKALQNKVHFILFWYLVQVAGGGESCGAVKSRILYQRSHLC